MIVTDAVRGYLDTTRPPPDTLLSEMQAHGARERIPILDAQSGALLHVLARAIGARRVVEVGTAIGVSTLALARALPAGGELVSFEIDPERHAAAQRYLDRDGLAADVDLRLQDARAGLAELTAPFDLAFLDGVKAEYEDYLALVVPLLRPGGLVAVDNVLMSGTVAENRSDGHWTDEQIARARAFNERLLDHPQLVATITPVGDGIALAARR
ncbi:MAG TPA: O-methyltransferase [Conexibacter sp.]|jgi:predicted O-methyltransferase YrrM|nr:O-methyltransferase [Conexibacter sp.]